MMKLNIVVLAGLLFQAGLFGQGQIPRESETQQTVQAQSQQSWTGDLADADCKLQNPADPCVVTDSTSAFGLVSGGQFLPFDAEGNRKAAQAVKKGGGKPSLNVTVKGTLDGDVLKVESIQVH